MKQSWPNGFRVIYCLLIVGFLVTTGQLVYYVLPGRGLFPDEIGGKWALVSYAGQAINITLGSYRSRRLFALGVAALCLYEIPIIAFYTWPLIRYSWELVFSGGMTFAGILTWDTWCLVWNNICLSLDIGVLLYLLSYEFRLFGPGKIAPRTG